MPDHVARITSLAGIPLGGTVLDVGTGTGVMLGSLIDAIGATGRICAIDVSCGMLQVAARKEFPANVLLMKADASTPCFKEDVFDAVICNAVFPHFADGPATLDLLVRLLRRGGKLVISHPIGREAVNRVHSSSCGPIQSDVVPSPAQMHSLLTDAGLTNIWILDEPDFYMASANRPDASFSGLKTNA
jgi:ubiquinone/menaquinone biosynthesis C-methylase UbiE